LREFYLAIILLAKFRMIIETKNNRALGVPKSEKRTHVLVQICTEYAEGWQNAS
jgi:hypothetical protein